MDAAHGGRVSSHLGPGRLNQARQPGHRSRSARCSTPTPRATSPDFNRELANYRKILADYEQSLAGSAGQLKAENVANVGNPSHAARQLRGLLQPVQPVLLRGRAVRRRVRAGCALVDRLDGAAPPRVDVAVVLTFALHTFALVARIYISGRPPVTNLYSSAIFIGWAGVLLALVFEYDLPLGLGNIVAAVDRLPHAARRQQPVARRRHVHRAAGRARHPVLARHARRHDQPRLRRDVRRRHCGAPSTSCWPTSFTVLDDNASRQVAPRHSTARSASRSSSASSARCSAACGPTTPGAASGAGTRRKTAR